MMSCMYGHRLIYSLALTSSWMTTPVACVVSSQTSITSSTPDITTISGENTVLNELPEIINGIKTITGAHKIISKERYHPVNEHEFYRFESKVVN